jgi:hypothetical protein
LELYIFNHNRKLAGLVEAFEYLRWTRRYSSCGSFEVKAVATDTNLALLRTGNIVWKNNDCEAAYIEHVELTMDGGEYITASGRFVTSILARRIVWNTENLSGDLSAAVGKLLDNNVIKPANSARRIERVTYVTRPQNANVNTQISYKNLLTAVTELCEAADIGIKTCFKSATGDFEVSLFRGGEVQGVFSREYENILAQSYMESTAGFANAALVGGEGEGSKRTFVSVGDVSGENRYEIFCDAKDLRSADFPNSYTDALKFRGQSKLAESAMIKAFDATLNQYGNLRYKIDFDVGSTVRVHSGRWAISMTARITEIEESYDKSGMSLDATLGKPLKLLTMNWK